MRSLQRRFFAFKELLHSLRSWSPFSAFTLTSLCNVDVHCLASFCSSITRRRTDSVEEQLTRLTALEARQECFEIWRNTVKRRQDRDYLCDVQVGHQTQCLQQGTTYRRTCTHTKACTHIQNTHIHAHALHTLTRSQHTPHFWYTCPMI